MSAALVSARPALQDCVAVLLFLTSNFNLHDALSIEHDPFAEHEQSSSSSAATTATPWLPIRPLPDLESQLSNGASRIPDSGFDRGDLEVGTFGRLSITTVGMSG